MILDLAAMAFCPLVSGIRVSLKETLIERLAQQFKEHQSYAVYRSWSSGNDLSACKDDARWAA